MFSCAHMSLCPVPAGGHGARTRGCSWAHFVHHRARMGGDRKRRLADGGDPSSPAQIAAAAPASERPHRCAPQESGGEGPGKGVPVAVESHKRVMRGLFPGSCIGTRHTVFQAWSQLGRLVSCSLIRAAKGYYVCKRTIYATHAWQSPFLRYSHCTLFMGKNRVFQALSQVMLCACSCGAVTYIKYLPLHEGLYHKKGPTLKTCNGDRQHFPETAKKREENMACRWRSRRPGAASRRSAARRPRPRTCWWRTWRRASRRCTCTAAARCASCTCPPRDSMPT